MNKLTIYFLSGLCLLTLFQQPVFADPIASASEVLEAKLRAMHTMSAAFKQQVQAKHRRVQSSSGTMALSRPGLFRWQTNHPTSQLVIADGQHIWIYDKELEQVSVKKEAKSLGGAAALFLNEDPASLSRDFQVLEEQHASQNVFVLRARSTKASFEKVNLIFDKDTLKQITLYDQLGQRTTISFYAVKINPKIARSAFHFTVPKGVDVVQQ